MAKKTQDNEMMHEALMEALSYFVPANGEEADYEPTTYELQCALGQTVEVSTNELCAEMKRQGFHFKLIGNVFRWQIKVLQ